MVGVISHSLTQHCRLARWVVVAKSWRSRSPERIASCVCMNSALSLSFLLAPTAASISAISRPAHPNPSASSLSISLLPISKMPSGKSGKQSSTARRGSQAPSRGSQDLTAKLELLSISTAGRVDATSVSRSKHGSSSLTSPTPTASSGRHTSVSRSNKTAVSSGNNSDAPPPLDWYASDTESESSFLGSTSTVSSAGSQDDVNPRFAQPMPRAEDYAAPQVQFEERKERRHDRGMEKHPNVRRWLEDNDLAGMDKVSMGNTSLPVRFHVRYSS